MSAKNRLDEEMEELVNKIAEKYSVEDESPEDYFAKKLQSPEFDKINERKAVVISMHNNPKKEMTELEHEQWMIEEQKRYNERMQGKVSTPMASLLTLSDEEFKEAWDNGGTNIVYVGGKKSLDLVQVRARELGLPEYTKKF